MTRIFFVLVFAACMPLVHVDPQLRSDKDAYRAAVTVYVSCSNGDPFPANHEFRRNPGVSWFEYGATGVVISERHVLTATHVVDQPCPWIPSMVVVVGRTPYRVHVERIAGDVARLEILSGSFFGLGVAPPRLGNSDGLHYHVATRRGMWVGDRIAWHGLKPSDSGSGVYAHDGALVGILLGTDEHGWLKFARVDETWLKGT